MTWLQVVPIPTPIPISGGCGGEIPEYFVYGAVGASVIIGLCSLIAFIEFMHQTWYYLNGKEVPQGRKALGFLYAKAPLESIREWSDWTELLLEGIAACVITFLVWPVVLVALLGFLVLAAITYFRKRSQVFKEGQESNNGISFKEMEDYFVARTENHRKSVEKYCELMATIIQKPNTPPHFLLAGGPLDNLDLEAVAALGKEHDKSKLSEPEKTPYVYLTWKHKCDRDRTEFSIPVDMEERIIEASCNHLLNNSHHPESLLADDEVSNFIELKKKRENIPIIDATPMTDLAMAEMVADWCAMGDELNNSPYRWAMDNIGTRWKFSEEQEKFIYALLRVLLDNTKGG